MRGMFRCLLQILAASLWENEKHYPDLFALFDDSFYDGATNARSERYTHSVKPAAEYYKGLKDFLTDRNFAREKTIFIDDKCENISGARKANVGIDAIHFRGPEQLREEFKKRGFVFENKNEPKMSKQ